MERGQPPVAERAGEDFTIERLLENTDDAYTFPPFSEMAPKLVLDGLDYPALRARERELLAQSVATARRYRVRIEGYAWADVIPELLYPTLIGRPPEVAAGSPEAPRERVGVAVGAPSRTPAGAADPAP